MRILVEIDGILNNHATVLAKGRCKDIILSQDNLACFYDVCYDGCIDKEVYFYSTKGALPEMEELLSELELCYPGNWDFVKGVLPRLHNESFLIEDIIHFMAKQKKGLILHRGFTELESTKVAKFLYKVDPKLGLNMNDLERLADFLYEDEVLSYYAPTIVL